MSLFDALTTARFGGGPQPSGGGIHSFTLDDYGINLGVMFSTGQAHATVPGDALFEDVALAIASNKIPVLRDATTEMHVMLSGFSNSQIICTLAALNGGAVAVKADVIFAFTGGNTEVYMLVSNLELPATV